MNQSPPLILGIVQAGARLTCFAGGWTSTGSTHHVAPIDYQWFLSTDLVDPLPNPSPRHDRYSPPATDGGKSLVCRVTERDNDDHTTATADSAATAPLAPLPSVTITKYSSRVSGSLGEPLAGVSLTGSLVRHGITVATVTATTNSSGDWSASLASVGDGPDHGFYPGDGLSTHYAPPAADPDATVPPDFTYGGPSQSLFFPAGAISSDGTQVTVAGQSGQLPCSKYRVLINQTQATPAGSPNNCLLTTSAPLSDNDVVGVQLTIRTLLNGSGSVVRLRTAAGLVGASSLPPTCNADLASGEVSCFTLTTGQFALSVDGGSPQPLTITNGTGTATLPGLKAGDTVTLDETSPTPTARHLMTLHVLRFQANFSAGTFVSGACSPGAPLSGVLCPLTGHTPDIAPLTLFDDRSGCKLTIDMPSLANMIPTDDASLSSGTFTAYVDLAGDQPADQLLAETKAVRLTVRPHGSETPVFTRKMTMASDSDGAFASTHVSGLSTGRYFADWVLTDHNGDTNTFERLFAVQ